ncbi:hypothetical protein KI387_008725, partial [Taxus chinensis]
SQGVEMKDKLPFKNHEKTSHRERYERAERYQSCKLVLGRHMWIEGYSFDPGIVAQLNLKGMIRNSKGIGLWCLEVIITSSYTAVLEQQSHHTVSTQGMSSLIFDNGLLTSNSGMHNNERKAMAKKIKGAYEGRLVVEVPHPWTNGRTVGQPRSEFHEQSDTQDAQPKASTNKYQKEETQPYDPHQKRKTNKSSIKDE